MRLILFTAFLILGVSVQDARAGIFDVKVERVRYGYAEVQAKTRQLVDKVITNSCPHLVGAELKKCLAAFDGYGMHYGRRREKVALFVYSSHPDDVFGVEWRDVEEMGVAFQIRDDLAILFVLSRTAVKTGDHIELGESRLRVYLREVREDTSLSEARTELTVPGQGWIDIRDRVGNPRPPKKTPGIYSSEAQDGIQDLYLAAQTAFRK